MNVDGQIKQVKNSIVNSTIFLICLLLLPTSILHIFRARSIGVTPVTYAIQIWLILYILLFLLRNKISLKYKISIIIVSLFMEFILESISMGMLSTHTTILVITLSLSAMYVGLRMLLFISTFGFTLIGIIAVGWVKGYFALPISPQEFMETPISWILRIYSLLVLSVAVAGSIHVMMKHLKESIIGEESKKLEIQDLLSRENSRLEGLVEKKTMEIKDATREIMKKEKLASLGSLVAGVSHEINTPLGVSVTAASHLSDIYERATDKINSGTFTKEDFISYFREVEETNKILNSNLYKASELVKSFKAISVNQTNSISTRFTLESVVDATILTLKHEYKSRDIEFICDIPKDLYLDSYPGAFSQVFTNLIMNSLTHGFPTDYKGIISFDVKLDRSWVLIRYRDNGVGISKELLGKIFDPFFTTNRGSGGSGLGLNIVYNIVTDKLKGTILCSSDINKGTEFQIKIPHILEGGINE